jgi:hypothetical protein
MFSLRICMPHSIDEGAVRFLRPDGEDYENALAVFERECVRIVAEECASRDAEAERRTEKQIVTAALRLYLDAEVTP